jgi:hypothetical protein
MASLAEGRVIEERVANRLFNFLDELSGEEQMRDVRFFVRDFRWPLRINGRVHHSPHHGILILRSGFRSLRRLNVHVTYLLG